LDSLFIFLRCHPITCEESHTGPSIFTFFSFADSKAIGHAPNTLQNYIYVSNSKYLIKVYLQFYFILKKKKKFENIVVHMQPIDLRPHLIVLVYLNFFNLFIYFYALSHICWYSCDNRFHIVE
jgi:hypothetical protein